MIPHLIDLGGSTPWLVLPPGIHSATLAEVASVFANTPHRKRLFNGFSEVVLNLWSANCAQVFLDGSFVTNNPHPGDFDGCWDPNGVIATRLDPVLLRFENNRAAQKAKFGGEMFMSSMYAAPGKTYLEFFQIEKYSGKNKGILLITS